MAIDYQKIALTAKQDYEKKQADKEEAIRIQRMSYLRHAAECTEFLKNHVVEALNKAKPIFKADDIDIEIKTEFDVSEFVSKLPAVQAKMSRIAPGRKDGYQNSSATVHYTCDGETLSVRLDRDFGSNKEGRKLGESKGDQIETLVGQSISELAESFYRAVENYRHI